MEPFNFVDLCKIELLEIELFDHLTMCKQFIVVWLQYLELFNLNIQQLLSFFVNYHKFRSPC